MKIETRVGDAGFDDHRFRGASLYRELLGSESVASLLALALDGRRRTPEEAAMLDDLAVVVAVADPRIWPCKLVRVASAYGSSLAGVAAATYAMDEAMIGSWTTQGPARWLQQIRARRGDDPAAEALAEELAAELGKGGRLLGFGVPARGRDERVIALSERIDARGRGGLPYWRMTQRLIALMRAERSVEPNISIVFAAACLDLGFDAEHVGLLATALWQPVTVANAAEGSAQQVLRTLPAESVEYLGPAPRKSSRRAR